MHSTTRWIYGHSPHWIQNLGISLYGLSYRKERLGGDYEKYVEGFRTRDRWSKAQLSAYVEHQLAELLVRAFDQVPHYRKRWSDLKLSRGDLTKLKPSELQRLPLTSKAEVRIDPRSFVAANAGQAEKLRRYDTSGSTGTPIATYCCPSDHRCFVAAREVRSFNWAGVSIQMPRAMIGGRSVVPEFEANPPYYRRNRAEKQVYFSAYHISRATAANYVEGFNRYRPEFSTGYAYSHYMLARAMETEGLRLNYSPRAFVLSSEALTAEMKSTIRRNFGVRAYEEYGAVENCVLATECEHGSLHVNPDFALVEILDDAGEPVSEGRPGRVVCTGFANRSQPLIRYDIGDIATWSTQTCACGRNQLPVLSQLIGRLEDIIVGRKGRGILRFHSVFTNLRGVAEGQVIQDALDCVRVRVVGDANFGADTVRTLQRRVALELGDDIEVKIERVAEIERTVRGKFRAVINRLPREVVESALYSSPETKPSAQAASK